MRRAAVIAFVLAVGIDAPASAQTAAVPPGTARGKSYVLPPNSALLTPGEIDTFRKHVFSCWVPPQAPPGELRFVVVRVQLQRDGRLKAPPKVIEARAAEPQQARSDAERAVAAVTRCAPYAELPPDKYEVWGEVEIRFEADRGPAAR